MRTSMLILIVALLLTPYEAFAINASVDQKQIAVGESASAKVDVTGTVGVESDISQTSSDEKVTADGTVPIGTPKAAGLYFVRLIADDKSSTILTIVVTDADGGNLFVQSLPVDGSLPPVTGGMADLLQKFADSIGKDNYALAKAAAKKTATDWAATNVVSVSGTVTICILPVPGAQTVCIARIGDHLIDLGFAFTNELVNESADLTSDEKDKLLTWVHAGRTTVDLYKLLNASDRLDQILKATTVGTNILDEQVKDKSGAMVGLQVFSNNAVGLIDKTALTIKLVKP